MVSPREAKYYTKNQITYYTGKDVIPCPICGGSLRYHGRCRRQLRDEKGKRETVSLRVLKCEDCGKTHRELPSIIVPYKRYAADAICTILEAEEEWFGDYTVRARICNWVRSFLLFGRAVEQKLKELLKTNTWDKCEEDDLLSEVNHFTALVVNSGNWPDSTVLL